MAKPAVQHVEQAATVVGGSGATGKAPNSTGGKKTASGSTPAAAGGARGSASSSSSSTASGAHVAATTSVSSASPAASGKSADVSTSDDIEEKLEALFEQNSPEFYLGNCLEVVSTHEEWGQKMTILLLDLPFGVLDESHDRLIPANDVLRLIDFLLKPQGSAVLFCTPTMIKQFDFEITKFPELLPEQEMSVR